MALVGLLVCCIIWGTWSTWKYFAGSRKALTSSDHDMFQHLHSRLRSSNDKISNWCSDSFWNCFTGRSTGQAYVQFATVELANKALERNRLDSHLFFTQLWGLKACLWLSFSIWWHLTLSLLLNFFLSLFKHTGNTLEAATLRSSRDIQRTCRFVCRAVKYYFSTWAFAFWDHVFAARSKLCFGLSKIVHTPTPTPGGVNPQKWLSKACVPFDSSFTLTIQEWWMWSNS